MMLYILECVDNLILLEERKKSYKERRIIRGAPAKPGGGKSRKMKSLYPAPKPFKRKRRSRIIRENRRRVF